ncbi:MAG: DMT family transporter [Chloroflexi bacterium]|nr:DMT family transporter [Chloroflexota bacterium]
MADFYENYHQNCSTRDGACQADESNIYDSLILAASFRALERTPLNQLHPRLLLPLALLLAILAVSTASIFIKFAQRDAPSLVIAALRLTFASLALAPLAWTRHRAEILSLTRRELLFGLLSGLFLSVHFATWISSLEYTTIASSVVLVSTGPLWVALMSPLFLREPLTRPVLIGMAVALLGGVIIGLSDSCSWNNGLACDSFSQVLRGRALFGNLLALAGALAVSGYLMIGRKLRTKTSLIPYIFVVYSTAAIGLLIIMFAAGETPVGYQPMTYVWILLLALVPQLIGHSTYNWALAHLPAAFVAIATLGEPIGSAILAFFILQEAPPVATLAGGTLILLGIYLSTRK